MGAIKEPERLLPVAGFLFAEGFPVDKVIPKVTEEAGMVLCKSRVVPFNHTRYYRKEMGGNVLRQWYLFDKRIRSSGLVELKRKTNDIEKEYLNEAGGRRINIDPGMISLGNLVLASTKNFSHRIYLGKGIFGEVTLIYKDKRFNPLEWTFQDYREEAALDFFSEAREILKNRLREESRDTSRAKEQNSRTSIS